MPFVKLDVGLLDSSLWLDDVASRIFLTALLMAQPKETTGPLPQIEVDTLRETGWSVPPGWYGFIAAAGTGIIRRSILADIDAGMAALKRLGEPEAESKSPDFEGRRLVRVDGGYIVLNFQAYREKDYGSAARMKRWRASQKELAVGDATSSSPSTASIPPGFEDWWAHYPRKVGKGAALRAWRLLTASEREAALAASPGFAEAWQGATADRMQFCPHPTTFIHQKRYTDDPAEWKRQAGPEAPVPFAQPQRAAFPKSSRAIEADELEAEALQQRVNRDAYRRAHAEQAEIDAMVARGLEKKFGEAE